MIDKAGAVSTLMTRLKKIPAGHELDMQTYKRDRSVVVLRVGEDTYRLKEKGFEENTFETDFKGLKKLLKALLKREFPRSNKIRVYERESRAAPGITNLR